MTTQSALIDSGRALTRAYGFLDRAGEVNWPTEAQLITKRGLLDEARKAVDEAAALLRG